MSKYKELLSLNKEQRTALEIQQSVDDAKYDAKAQIAALQQKLHQAEKSLKIEEQKVPFSMSSIFEDRKAVESYKNQVAAYEQIYQEYFGE